MSEKRPRSTGRFRKRDPAYWRGRLFRNVYTYKGRQHRVGAWSVKIQLFGRRKAFTLSSLHQSGAAREASRIYRAIVDGGWEAVVRLRARTGPGIHVTSSALPAAIRYDSEYWKRRLIHRRYPEPSGSQHEGEFSIWIEHARTSEYFPLGTSDEDEAAARAIRIYRTVVNHGWGVANASFPREVSLALRWQDNPLAWTYTTMHTRHSIGAPKPAADPAGRSPEQRVVFIEPDAGIRLAMAAAANDLRGFRCDATFAGAAEALREISHRRVDLALANHDLPSESDVAALEALQRLRPGLVVLSYSVFEDADQLFKSTPGGAAVYMLKRTPVCRLFEPIADLTGPATREQVASHVRKYFQQLAALLPSGPPFWKLAKLTPREHEVLAFLSKGDLVKEIAASLHISKWTVQSHLKSIFEKLNVHTRTEAVVKYLRK